MVCTLDIRLRQKLHKRIGPKPWDLPFSSYRGVVGSHEPCNVSPFLPDRPHTPVSFRLLGQWAALGLRRPSPEMDVPLVSVLKVTLR